MKFRDTLTLDDDGGQVNEDSDADDNDEETPNVETQESKNTVTGDENAEPEEPKKEIPLIELIALKKKQFQETKSLVGSTCVSIVSNPEKHIDRLKSLLTLLDTRKDDAVFKVSCLKTHTLIAYALLEVFRDILPSYRVREKVSEEELRKAKKETRDLRIYETSLLKYYKMYVARMERMAECIKKKKRSDFYDLSLSSRDAKEKMCLVGVRCLSTLLVCHPYFNGRDDLVQALVPLMTCKVPEVRQCVFDHITRLYREDKLGQVSLVSVKATGKVIKALKQNVHPLVIQSFLSLNIREVKKKEEPLDMAKERQKLSKMSRKEKRHNKQLQKLKNELKETEAHEDQDKKLHVYTQILNQIIYIYFRFVKDFLNSSESVDSKNEDHDILTPVLEGLSKFAHLINIDFFDALISLLFRLIASERMSGEQTLFCLNTVFTILAGEGSSLNVDPQRFYAKLYTSLLSFDIETESENHMNSADLCLDKMLIKRKKQLSLSRVLSFCKRLTTMSLHSTSATAAGYLSYLRLLLQDHSKADILMDTEHFGGGSFLPELDDPEFCNANATRVWELHLLRRHFHPKIEKFASFHLYRAKNKNIKSDLALKSPVEVHGEVSSMDMDLGNLFDDNIRKQYLKIANNRKKQSRYSFIDSPDSLTSVWMKSVLSEEKAISKLEAIPE